MKNLTMARNLSAKVASTILLVGLLLSSVALNASFGSETQALQGSWEDFAERSWFLDADEEEDSYNITNAKELAGLAKLVNEGNDFAGKTINIIDQINLGDHYWVPIGRYEGKPFRGEFNGNNCSIFNMKIGNSMRRVSTDYSYTGLFGRVQNGTIKNLILGGNSSIFAADSEVGGIVGSAEDNSTIDFCTNYCKIHAYDSSVAGIAGFMKSSKVINCSNYGEIKGFSEEFSSFTAGIAGNAMEDSQVINCGNYNKIYSLANDNKIAGIVAYLSDSNVNNCINCGEVNGAAVYFFDGAIVGWFDGGDISSNYYLEGSTTRAVGFATANHAEVEAVSIEDIESFVLDTLNKFALGSDNLESKLWAPDIINGYPTLLNAMNI